MSGSDLFQICLYLAVLLACVVPVGAYMARVLDGSLTFLGPMERLFYRVSGVDPAAPMTWTAYAGVLLWFNLAGTLAVYGILRVQHLLPLNPQSFGPVDPHTAFNIAISFATNTNWQNYGGETTLSYLTQMLALTVQNFVSAASGIAVLAALARGLAAKNSTSIGNFWADLTRTTLYLLLPLSIGLALLLVGQGVIQNFDSYVPVAGTQQVIPMGPVASQVAIKQLGTNGGGFFNVNSAHPFENPTPVSNFLQVISILLIPAALCYTFGKLVNDKRQGWALLAAMLIIFVPLVFLEAQFEQGNLEGKEVRFGTANSAVWAVATTAASNGSVNSMHDSFTPLGGLIPLFLMQLGEVVFGGVGSGLYGMVIFAIIAVFLAGLMVGRTPEYLGKKIEAFEMKMASLVILMPPVSVLLGTAITVTAPMGLAGLQDRGPHGFSEILYAFSSMGNNNGSAFGGYGANNPLVNSLGGVAMFLGRYWVAWPVLAIAGSLAKKKTVPVGPGTLPTHTPLFTGLLVGAVLLVGMLAFIPALALGPVVEALQ
ncbi:MAG: potassium-transporting ATPase subunit KdpA [Bryobacteraceae bacterium]|nr:potassium-transporting ATPase subunit KdpA [Bryobacteraceae bacterium]